MEIQNFEKFFLLNMKIKKIFVELAPTAMDDYNLDSTLEYKEKLYKSLKEIKFYFLEISDIMNLCINKPIEEIFDKLFKKLEKNISSKDLYKEIVSDMRPSFINEVNNNCIGYLLLNGFYFLLFNCQSLNELLHLIHSYIVNKEDYYQKLPKINEIIEENKIRKITLYGSNTEIGNLIFQNFPLEMHGDDTDIVSLEKSQKILIMIRGLGHALTIEIDYFNDPIMIRYFIPKICDPNMVNNLKGVKKVTDEDSWTTGTFETTKENFVKDLNSIILGVPTDDDLMNYKYPQHKNSR